MNVEFLVVSQIKKKWTLVIFIFTSKIMTGAEYIFRCLLASFFYVNCLFISFTHFSVEFGFSSSFAVAVYVLSLFVLCLSFVLGIFL